MIQALGSPDLLNTNIERKKYVKNIMQNPLLH